MRTRRHTYVRFLAVFALLGSLGLAASVYVLFEERAALPFRDVYSVRVEFSAADGVIEGVGQPVNVAGVKVGQVTKVGLAGGRAVVTLEIDRGKVPHVYPDARAILEPITPLEDMQIALNPGTHGRPLGAHDVIPVARTRPPVPAAELLSTLDDDTRTYLASLLSAVSQGTAGRAADIRAVLRALGPTVADAGRITRALDARRAGLARLVHNLGAVARAASQDRQLAQVVLAGNATLSSIAAEDAPLRSAISQFPATLRVARSTLGHIRPFAAELAPTLTSLLPALRRLPHTLAVLRPFAALGTTTVRRDVRPLVRSAQPLLAAAGPAVRLLATATPGLTSAARSLTYLFDEMAYNPPGDDEGFLFWIAWAGHNFNSLFDGADAHGNLGRAIVFASCNGIQANPTVQKLIGVVGLCPG